MVSVRAAKIISSSSELDNIEKYLVLYIGDDTAIFINSDHKCIQPFLFNQLKSNLSLNHKRIIDAMLNSKAITCIPSEKPYEELIQIQNYQFTRRTTMREKLLALKISGRTIPNYSKTMMRQLGKEASLKSRIRIFMGTIKRLHDGKI